jgi:DNA-binding CsgD family transcriptional regulator
MLILTDDLVDVVDQAQQSNQIEDTNPLNSSLPQEVLENLQYGILILSETGDVIHANASADNIFRQLNQDNSEVNVLLLTIWNLCKLLLKTQKFLREKNIVVSDEVIIDKSNIFLIRVRKLDINRFSSPFLLVTVENRYESIKNIALTEAIKYSLSQREAEIWCLHRAKYSYREIASYLFISINTVKKHIKNIHIKQQIFLKNKK